MKKFVTTVLMCFLFGLSVVFAGDIPAERKAATGPALDMLIGDTAKGDVACQVLYKKTGLIPKWHYESYIAPAPAISMTLREAITAELERGKWDQVEGKCYLQYPVALGGKKIEGYEFVFKVK